MSAVPVESSAPPSGSPARRRPGGRGHRRGLRRPSRHRRSRPHHPLRAHHRDRRPERVRKVDPAARAGTAAAARGRARDARWPRCLGHAAPRGRPSHRSAAAVLDRARRRAGRRARRPRALSAPGVVRPALERRRRRRGRGARRDRDRGPRRSPPRRALGRPAAAGLGGHGARPAHRHRAARRADDVPRRDPSARVARPAHRAQSRARHDGRHGAARAEPRSQVRRSPRRDALGRR